MRKQSNQAITIEIERVRDWLVEHPGRYTIRYLRRELRSTHRVIYRALCNLRDSGVAKKWGGGRTTMWKVSAARDGIEGETPLPSTDVNKGNPMPSNEKPV